MSETVSRGRDASRQADTPAAAGLSFPAGPDPGRGRRRRRRVLAGSAAAPPVEHGRPPEQRGEPGVHRTPSVSGPAGWPSAARPMPGLPAGRCRVRRPADAGRRGWSRRSQSCRDRRQTISAPRASEARAAGPPTAPSQPPEEEPCIQTITARSARAAGRPRTQALWAL
jgi:hypothetical protein